MFKYANNAVFWITFAFVILGLVSVNYVSSIYALDLAALDFLVWLGFVWARSEYASRNDILLPALDGPWVSSEKKLKNAPRYYLCTVFVINLVACLLVSSWWAAAIIVVVSRIYLWLKR